MRSPLNLDSLESEYSDLTINKKVYKVRSVPVALLIKLEKIQESTIPGAERLLGAMDVISDLIKLEHPEFDRKELDTLSIDAALKLLHWVISSTNTNEELKIAKKKSKAESLPKKNLK